MSKKSQSLYLIHYKDLVIYKVQVSFLKLLFRFREIVCLRQTVIRIVQKEKIIVQKEKIILQKT